MVRTRATSSTDTDDPRAASPLSDANRPVLHDRPAYEDVRSPYFLSTADHPGLALATPVLTDRNFQPWKRDFKLSIGARNKTPFLEGTLPQPSPDDPLSSSWIRCNQMVMSWILHSVSPEIKSSIMYLDTAAEMWSVLHNRFNQGNGPRIFELNESTIYLRQGDDSVSTYFTKLSAMWDEISQLRPRLPCTCAASIQHQTYLNNDQVLQFLTGLNESYHAVRAQILLIDPWPPLNKVFSMIVQQERQRTLGTRILPPLAAATPSASSSDATLANLASSNKRMRPTCSHCKKPGHLKDKCYFLHGFPPGYGNRRNADNSSRKQSNNTNPKASQVTGTQPDVSTLTPEQCQQLISILTQQLQPIPPPSNDIPAVTNFSGNNFHFFTKHWIVDSGATHHVCFDSTCFSSFNNTPNPNKVTLPDGTTVHIAKTGTVIINSEITLTNVLYVPQFRFNLISVSALLNSCCTNVLFTTNQCFLQGSSQILRIGTAKKIGNLYYLQQETNSSQHCSIPTACNVFSNKHQWHTRLGHPSVLITNKINKKFHFPIDNVSNFHC